MTLGLLLFSSFGPIDAFQERLPKRLSLMPLVVFFQLKALRHRKGIKDPKQIPLFCSQLVSESFRDAGECFELEFSKQGAGDTITWKRARAELKAAVSETCSGRLSGEASAPVSQLASVLRRFLERLLDFSTPAAQLVSALYRIRTGKETAKKEELLAFIDGGNLETFLVSPADLCQNCPSLNKVGVIRPKK